MTILSAFNARLGLGQGRVQPSVVAPPDGEYVFVIGADDPGWRADLEPGDHGQVAQLVDLSGVDLARVSLRLRVPGDLPTGMAWEVSLLVDGAKRARATCLAGRDRTLIDLAANVSKETGVHELAVRLELRSP